MKAALSIGANSPERFRSAAMMLVISEPILSAARKSVMAIGRGSMLPLLTSISITARAGRVAAAPMPAAKAPTIRIVRKKSLIQSNLFGYSPSRDVARTFRSGRN